MPKFQLLESLSRDLLVELIVTIDSVRADPEGQALFEHLLSEVPGICFDEGVETTRKILASA
jgi:hypothetical protein